MIVKTEFGSVNIKTEVIKEIVYKTLLESYGTVEMGKQNFLDKVTNWFTKEGNKGIMVSEEENGKVLVNVDLVLEYGLPLKKVMENAQEEIYRRIKMMTNYEDIMVSVNVVGIKS